MHPTIVIVHGSYHCPAHYQDLRDTLIHRGFSVEPTPHFPTSQYTFEQVDDPPPVSGWPTQQGDAMILRDILESLVKQGKQIVIFAHSSGSWTTAEALTEHLIMPHRRDQDSDGQGGVSGVI